MGSDITERTTELIPSHITKHILTEGVITIVDPSV